MGELYIRPARDKVGKLPRIGIAMTPELLTTVISASAALFGSLVGTVAVPFIKDGMAKSRDARFLAIRIVCILDRYVEECAMVVGDTGRPDEKGNSVPQVSAPKEPAYPTDVNWKSINKKLMYKLLALPAAIERGADFVSGSEQNSFPPDYSEWYEERARQYAILGLQAHELTKTLRADYGIEDVQNRDWNPVERLEDEMKEIVERTASRAEANRKMWEGIDAPKPPVQQTAA
jgi:hypothetical protein